MVVDQVRDEEIDRLFHAMADATRRDIMRRVIGSDLSISALARHYAMSLTAVQKHVSVLESAGLVHKTRRGREQRISGDLQGVRRAQDLLDGYEQLWRERVGRLDVLLSLDPPPTHQEDVP